MNRELAHDYFAVEKSTCKYMTILRQTELKKMFPLTSCPISLKPVNQIEK